MVDAVVLGCWENGYGVIRQLASQKLRVAGVFNTNAEVWRLSRYVNERKRAPNPAKEPAAFLDFLLTEAEGWRGALLIPTNDHYLEVISQERFTDAFAKGLRVGVQETIPAPDTNLYAHISYTSQDGPLLFEGIRRKVRQNPAHFGVARVTKTEWHSEVAELSRRLLRILKYRGICALEFKLDARTKRWVVLDANARFPLTNLVMIQAGINMAGLIYQDLIKGIRRPGAQARNGVYWINFNEDIRNTFLVARSERFTMRGWLEPYLGEHIFADLDLRDPVPFILRMGWMMQWFTKKIVGRLSKPRVY